MELTFDWTTTEGRRASNEDACCARPGLGLFAVADGMGGYEGGEVASRIAIETLVGFASCLARGDNLFLPSDVDYARPPEENVVAAAIRLADARIKAARVGPLAQMGSTVAMVQTIEDRVVVAHVGDSRVYRRRASKIECLTRDHSLYEELRASGADVPPKEKFLHAHVITRALGIETPKRDPDLRSEALAIGDTLLLCTDGVTDVLSDEDIGALLDGDLAAERIASAAYDAGSRDNITVLLLRRVD
ncbi:MAG: protein phosphatase 2C domain-containing protein [Deltaproteobacteria bacterium]